MFRGLKSFNLLRLRGFIARFYSTVSKRHLQLDIHDNLGFVTMYTEITDITKVNNRITIPFRDLYELA